MCRWYRLSRSAGAAQWALLSIIVSIILILLIRPRVKHLWLLSILSHLKLKIFYQQQLSTATPKEVYPKTPQLAWTPQQDTSTEATKSPEETKAIKYYKASRNFPKILILQVLEHHFSLLDSIKMNMMNNISYGRNLTAFLGTKIGWIIEIIVWRS